MELNHNENPDLSDQATAEAQLDEHTFCPITACPAKLQAKTFLLSIGALRLRKTAHNRLGY